jgi:hypothetical protein
VPPIRLGAQKGAPRDGFFQRTSQRQASAPRAAHVLSRTSARGRPQLVGKRSNCTLSHEQIQTGMACPGSGVQR